MTASSTEEKKRKDAQAALREALKDVVREEIAAFQEAVRLAISEERATLAPITQQQQDLSAELGVIDTQLETIRAELQFVRIALDLLVKAGQAHALVSAAPIGRTDPQKLASAATTRHLVRPGQQQEKEIVAVANEEADTEDGDEAALPLSRNIRLPKRDEGPAPLELPRSERQR